MTPEERSAALALARIAGDDRDGLRAALEALGLIEPKPERVVRIGGVDEPFRMKRKGIPDNCVGCGIELRKRQRKSGNPPAGRGSTWRYHGAHGMCTSCFNVYSRKRKAALQQGISAWQTRISTMDICAVP